ncbi:hypothetical protein H180DRAFT_00803 [Streptomyces sp. WMMB 322]|nr:hypothetical protein H180DRAFT_00803 [Streptomyces sp. WMMB 322]
MNYQLDQHARDLAITALCLRVFGPTALAALRRVAAVGVRTGVSELQRRRHCQENER